ncbi:MAG: B12-binding domain-containing radical SAM protein, partial [Firmicutes bacterium]|nr:B12-binding domain-containing radical SAM protein [Bacillota bacterium]
ENGIGDDYYAVSGLDTDAPLPWEIIDCGVDRSYLLSEYDKAFAEQTTPDCRVRCNACGINRHLKCVSAGVLSR